MSPGYGEKIYTRRPAGRRRIWLSLLLLPLLIGLAWLINRPQAEVPPPAQPSPITDQTLSPDPSDPPPAEPESTRENPPRPDNRTPSAPVLEAASANPIPSGDDFALSEGRLLLEARKYLSVIEKLLPRINQSPQAMLLVAEAYRGLKRYAESRELFERYLEKDPDNLAVIRRLVSTCYALNQLEDALHWCEHGLTLAAHDPELTAVFHELNREQATSSKFISRESEHFVVTFDRGEHADTRQQVLSILENAHRHVGGDLGVYPERKIPVILYTQQAFFDVTRAPGWAGGLYDGKIRLPVGSMGDDSDELARILTHEYVHAAIHQITDRCPRWINEGLAELFSQPEVPDIGQVIPLTRLEHSFPSAPNAAVAAAYAQSHAAVAYLIDRYSLSDLLNLLREMGEGVDFRTAFQSVYVIDLDQFIRSWGE